LVDRDKGLEQVRHLEDLVAELREYAQLPPERVVGERQVQSAVRYAFMAAIQCLLDVGIQVLIDAGAPRPQDNRHVLRELGAKGILPPEFAQRIEGMAGFRNLLAHAYASVDSAIVDSHLRQRLGDLETAARFLRQHVARQQPES
jgi:uncharacterized protein YutE (UPF0331/DUF86 family)